MYIDTIIKVSQLLSSEIKLSRLLDKLIHVLIEFAGAQRVVLVWEKEGNLEVMAEGRLSNSGIKVIITDNSKVAQNENQYSNSTIPHTIISHVINTKKSVVLNQANIEGLFINDPYIKKDNTISILCIPLLKQGKLKGILYLENNLISGAFTDGRSELMMLLSAQITILIENSSLYTNLEKSEQKYCTLVENMHEAVFIIQDDKIKYANKAFIKMTNYDLKEIIDKNFLIVIPPEYQELVKEYYKKMQVSNDSLFEYEGQILQKNRRTRCAVIVNVSMIPFNENKAVLVTLKDITERKKTEEKLRIYQYQLEELVEERTRELKEEIKQRQKAQKLLEELAGQDFLTGLPNRKLFLERLEHAIALGKRHKFITGILYIDLDGFKVINDTYGHDMGDKVLLVIAERLLGCVRMGDTVARMGGDEFTIIMENIEEVSSVDLVCQRIIDEIGKPMILVEEEMKITVSMGASICPVDSDNIQELINKADDFMYQAKKTGKNKYIISNQV